MKNLRFITNAAVAICLVLQCSCSVSPLSGNSSQTGNNGITIAAMKQSISGTTHPFADVSIYDSNYLPHKSPSGFTTSTKANDSGYFEFSNLAANHYNLLVQDIYVNEMAFVQQIPIITDSVFTDTLDKLQRPGFLTGIATDTSDKPLLLSYVYIKGSPFYTVSKNNGEFLFGPLPVGNYSIGLYASFKQGPNGVPISASSPTENSRPVTVYPDSTSVYHW